MLFLSSPLKQVNNANKSCCLFTCIQIKKNPLEI